MLDHVGCITILDRPPNLLGREGNHGGTVLQRHPAGPARREQGVPGVTIAYGPDQLLRGESADDDSGDAVARRRRRASEDIPHQQPAVAEHVRGQVAGVPVPDRPPDLAGGQVRDAARRGDEGGIGGMEGGRVRDGVQGREREVGGLQRRAQRPRGGGG